jgi:chromosome segregation ATPase
MLTDRLRSLEQESSNLIQEKKELSDAIESEKQISKEFDEKNQKLLADTLTCRSHMDALTRLTTELQGQIPVAKGDLEKFKGRIPLVERDIEKKRVVLGYLNKQVDLLKELKTLDLQQLQMISQGGANMQNTLYQFIKNWEKIKTL